MFSKIGAFFKSLPSELYVFLISILPFIELRGAIPVGAALSLPLYVNFIISVLGNLLPVPFILLFIPKILDFLAKFKLFKPMVEWLRKKADKGSEKLLAKAKGKEAVEADTPISPNTESSCPEEIPTEKRGFMTKGIFIALLLFVAIPAPGTGAWTGSLVASLFGLSKRSSFLAIALGVLLCAVIMSLASYGILGFLKFLL